MRSPALPTVTALVGLLLALAAAPAADAAQDKVVETAPATAECTYPLAVDCPRDEGPPIPFADVPEGVGSVKVTYQSTEYCAPMLLIVYDNGKVAGETSVVGGDTTNGGNYPDEGSTSFSLDPKEDHALAYRGKVTGFGCGAGTHPGEVLTLHLFTGDVVTEYTPPPEGVVIKGSVRIENDKGIPASASGVPGATVQISGPGGKKTAKVGATGTYSAQFKKAGSYSVFPRVPEKIAHGGRSPVKPPSREVNVKLGDSATADFTVKDPLRISIELSRDHVQADGTQTVKATIKAEADGKPVSGQDISLRPFDGATTPIHQLPVPATICRAGRGARLWPEPPARPGAEAGPVDVVTGGDGAVELTISVGTIPGDFALEAWAADGKGKLDTEHNILDVSPEAHLKVAPLPGGGSFESELTRLVKSDQSLALATKSAALAEQLAALTADGKLTGSDFAPIRSLGGTKYEAVLVYPVGGRIPLAADGTIEVGAPGGVLGTAKLDKLARAGLKPLPSLADWLAGSNNDWREWFPGVAGPVKPDVDGYTYLGYPYPAKGGCS
jgi:hypothetical protein